jgi:hypothetical protein
MPYLAPVLGTGAYLSHALAPRADSMGIETDYVYVACRQLVSDRIEKNIEDVLSEVVPPRAQTAPPRARVRFVV